MTAPFVTFRDIAQALWPLDAKRRITTEIAPRMFQGELGRALDEVNVWAKSQELPELVEPPRMAWTPERRAALNEAKALVQAVLDEEEADEVERLVEEIDAEIEERARAAGVPVFFKPKQGDRVIYAPSGYAAPGQLIEVRNQSGTPSVVKLGRLVSDDGELAIFEYVLRKRLRSTDVIKRLPAQ